MVSLLVKMPFFAIFNFTILFIFLFHMNDKAQYFSQKFNQKQFYAPAKNKWVSYGMFIIVLLSIIVFMIILFSKWDSIKGIFGWNREGIEVTNGTTLYIWDRLALTGAITDDGDIVNYTHKLYHADYGTIGLRSSRIDLSQYEGEVFVEWRIVAVFEETPIMEVESVNVPGILEETGVLVSTGTYVADAGIFFSPEFFAVYSLDSQTSDSIKVRNLKTQQTMQIDYFRCTTSNANRDCAALQKTFSASPEKTFSSSMGVDYYKLQEVSSWFFANGNRFGYFIHNAPEADVTDLASYLVLPNEYIVKQQILPNVSRLCREDGLVMNESTSSTISVADGQLVLDIEGTQWTGLLSCKIHIDLSQPLGGTLLKLTQKDVPAVAWDVTSDEATATVPVSLDPSVKQFPTSLEKTLDFVSRRGHTITFPSRNLSFKELNEDVDFDQAWVSCFATVNVIKYEKDEASKDQLVASSPAVKVHECRIKKWFTPAGNMIYTTVWDKSFVIEILDSAWVDFGNQISIKLN